MADLPPAPRPTRAQRVDKELEQYRNLMQPPDRFDEGFSLSSLFGVLFISLIMVPGAIYMGLLAGAGIGAAAQWVTVILFLEIAKRANAKMSRAQLFTLFFMAGGVMASADGGLLWTQFFVRSDAALSFGLAGTFPEWVAPSDPAAYENRTFFQWAWLPAIGLMVFKSFFSKLDSAIMSYGLFRVASDIERLPFPLAPVGAQGMMALADDLEASDKSKGNWRWRVFSIGGAIGLLFGLVYLGLPAITGAILGKTMQVLPIPFVDWSTYTQDWLPATATGLSFDLGQVILGMVMPFWAMVGSFAGLLITVIVNPIAQHAGVLKSWNPGDTTVEIMFKNNVDLYFSLGIGLSLAVAVVGLSSLFRLFGRKNRAEAAFTPPAGRGDIPAAWIIAVYLISTLLYIMVSWWLVDWHMGVLAVLIFFGFVYTPIISFVTARLEGIAGQVVEIPFIKEMSFILSGYHGVGIWFIPVPQANYGAGTVFYRQAELTGTKFSSLWKADAALFPIITLATIGFSSFIWGMKDIPSSVYPYTQQMWELNAKNGALVYASTSGEYSQFTEALSGTKVGIGMVIGMALFGGLSWINAPITLIYGLIRGIGQTMPHVIIPQMIGALIGRYYFEKRMGLKWREYVPVLAAGFAAGVGLISMLCIGLVFLSKSASSLPY